MRLLGKQLNLFGGGMGRVDFVLPLVTGKDVLDVGVVQHTVEASQQSNWLHRRVAEVAQSCLGIDSDKEGIDHLRSIGYNVRQADAQSFHMMEDFDVVLAGDIIEHLHDLAGFFESVNKHLRPDGQLIILTANPWFVVRVLQALLGRVYENPEHTAWYSPGTLSELLGRFGYRIADVRFGSSEHFLRRLPLPSIMRHTSVWVVAERGRSV